MDLPPYMTLLELGIVQKKLEQTVNSYSSLLNRRYSFVVVDETTLEDSLAMFREESKKFDF